MQLKLNRYFLSMFTVRKILLNISFDLYAIFYICPVLTFIRETKLVCVLNCAFLSRHPFVQFLGISPLAFLSQKVRTKYLHLFLYYFIIFVCHYFSEVILFLCRISSLLLSEITFSSLLSSM